MGRHARFTELHLHGADAGIAWQAPAAGGALAVFYALWCIMIINAGGTPGNIPYDTIFNFSGRVDLSPKPLPKLTAIRERGQESSTTGI